MSATVAGRAVVPFQGDFSQLASGASSAVAGIGDGWKKSLLGPSVLVGAAVLGIAGAAVKMAGDFQSATTTIVTGAGESVKNIGMIRDGVLSLAGQVGQTPAALAAGLYNIESAGYHGAAGLIILKAAAEGAAVGGADMAVVADAVTSALNAYALPATKATSVTNDLIATVAAGKMHMADLAASIGSILAPASAVGVNLAEVSAAIATMTMQGTGAAQATTYLRQMVISLSAELPKGVASLKDIGLSADTVSAGLKKQPDGFINQLTIINEALDKKFPASAAMAKTQFALVKSGAETANQALTNLSQNGGAGYINALRNISGGSKQMMGMLELTGSHIGVLDANFASISAAANKGGTSISGWTLVQGDFNQRMAEAKAGLDAFMIRLGGALLPILSTVVGFVSSTVLPSLNSFASWFSAVAAPALQQFAAWVMLYLVTPLVHVTTAVVPVLIGVFSGIVGTFGTVFSTLSKFGLLIPIIGGVVAGFLIFKTVMAVQALMSAVAGGIAAVQVALMLLTGAEIPADVATTGLAGALLAVDWPLALIVAGVAGAIAVGVLLVTHWNLVKSVAGAVWGYIGGVVTTVWNQIKGVILPVMAVIVGVVSVGFNVIKSVISVALAVLMPIIKIWWTVVSTIFGTYLTIVITIIKVAFAAITVAWNVLSTAVKIIVQALWDTVSQIFQIAAAVVIGIVNGIATVITAVWNAIKGWVIPIVQGIGLGITLAFALVRDTLANIWAVIQAVIKTVWGAITTVFTTFATVIGGIFTGIRTALSTVWTGIGNDVTGAWNGIVSVIKGAVNTIISIIDGIIGGINTVTGLIPGVGKSLHIPLIPQWHAGGGLFTSPTVIGVAEAGPEVVMNRPQFQAMQAAMGGGAGGAGGTNISTVINIHGITDTAIVPEIDRRIGVWHQKVLQLTAAKGRR
jgi:TP901 family phage tail tape measure protein